MANNPIQNQIASAVCALTNAKDAFHIESIQSLWSGYGEIARYQLIGANQQTAVVKYIAPPEQSHHPRGWNTQHSHNRKLQSYRVETAWYQHWASLCTFDCRVPRCFGVEQFEQTSVIVLEDLDQAGFALRKSTLNQNEYLACVRWLAHFHGRFLGLGPEKSPHHGLWPEGTYWHLDTRPDELAAMEEGELKSKASLIDKALKNAEFQTIVHGDAKVANFCFSESASHEENNTVAAVDFQYVGFGCGMKDLAYFMGSCLDEEQCQAQYSSTLNYYFAELAKALAHHHTHVDAKALEQEWRALFPMAWADFERFLAGWMPTHKKRNRFSHALTQQALSILG